MAFVRTAAIVNQVILLSVDAWKVTWRFAPFALKCAKSTTEPPHVITPLDGDVENVSSAPRGRMLKRSDVALESVRVGRVAIARPESR